MIQTAYFWRTQSLMSVQMNIRISSSERNLSSQVHLCRIMPLLKAIEKLETLGEPNMGPQLKNEYAVEAEGLKKSFGYHHVLTGVSFKAQRGEHLVILGGNGCGKTTLINILATICHPSQGKVVIEGLDIRQQAANIRQKLGVVAHATMLYDDLTITENLRFYGRMYGVEALEEKIKEMILPF